MKNRKIRSLEVSPIGIGCMGFSHGYGKVPEEKESIASIRKAYEFGCTFFDTAEAYGKEMFYPGHNEELVGKALSPFRNNVVLATKYHLDEKEVNENRTLYTAIRNHLIASMEKLRTDYVDLYYLHRINEQISIEEIAEAQRITPIGAVQNLYSMVERDCEQEIFPYCLENEIAVVPFSPIASGFLSGKVTPDTPFEGDDVRKFVPQLAKENLIANQPILNMLVEVAKEKQATNAQISLAWMLHKYPNAVPIPGSKNLGRILENLAAWDVRLTDTEFQAIENQLNQIPVYGHRGHVESQQQSFGKHWEKH